MALSVASVKKTVFGNKRVVIVRGTAASGDTSGTVTTGLNNIDFGVANWTDLADKNILLTYSGGVATLTFTNPAATKNWEAMFVGN